MIHNEELHELARHHFNEPIILYNMIARLIGYAEDDEDCYFIVHTAKGIIWATCVGGYYFLDKLKGQGYVKAHNGEDWDDLYRLDQELILLGIPQAKEFILKDENNMEGKLTG